MSSSDEWVEQSGSSQQAPKRESWMDISDVIPTVTRAELRARSGKQTKREQEKMKARASIDELGQHERELNPYWKDGGKGIPSQKLDNKPSTSVGDGGVAWLRKAYQRVEEQSQEEGRSVEDIAAERWGSLANLKAMLSEAESKNKSSHRQDNTPAYRSRSSYHKSRDSGKSSDRYSESRKNSDSRRNSEKYSDSARHSDKYSDSGRGSDRYLESRKSSESSRRPSEKIPPTFSKPKDDFDFQERRPVTQNKSSKPRWMKTVEAKPEEIEKEELPQKNVAKSEPAEQPKADIVETLKAAVISEVATESDTPAPLTDKEMNQLGAKILKAELMGNESEAKKLKSRLENAQKAKEMGLQPGGSSGSNRKEETVILMQSNARGMSRPLTQSEDSYGTTSSKKKKIKVATHDSEGQRLRYFHDDEKFSLNQMFEREKFTSADDETAMYLKMAAKGKLKTDEDYDIDDVYVEKAARGKSSMRDDQEERSNAIHEHKRLESALERCNLCLDSNRMQKHLIIAIGIKVYLSLPNFKSLTDGHCLIVPMGHVTSGTLLDEDVWSEVQIFRKGLTKMFQEQGKDTVFMETSLNLRRHPHAYVECIPIDEDIGNMAPMYFKKAILESETEWSHNKKLVDLSKKDVRHSVPRGLPYFSVDFGLQGGFAHVVEDEKDFPSYFGQEIVGGLIDAEPRLWLKPVKEPFEEQRTKVLEFEQWWKPYDWTQRLKAKNDLE